MLPSESGGCDVDDEADDGENFGDVDRVIGGPAAAACAFLAPRRSIGAKFLRALDSSVESLPSNLCAAESTSGPVPRRDPRTTTPFSTRLASFPEAPPIVIDQR
jgi:hypothetical protein